MTNCPNVYIVMLNWNHWQETMKGLESILEMDYPNYHVLICDNGSTNDSLEQIKNWINNRLRTAACNHNPCNDDHGVITKQVLHIVYDQTASEPTLPGEDATWILMSLKKNLGYTGGINICIKYILEQNPDYVFLLDNDAKVPPDTLQQLINVANEADAAIVGCRLFTECGTKELFAGQNWPEHLFGLSRSHRTLPDQHFIDSYYADGAAVLLRRDFISFRLRHVGHLLNPAFFMYCEDVELCLHATAHGYRCVIALDAIAYHGLSQSGGGAGNPHSYYYITRNRIFLAREWLKPPWNMLFHLYYVPSRLLLHLTRTLRRRPSQWHAVRQGLIDGYRNVTGRWSMG